LLYLSLKKTFFLFCSFFVGGRKKSQASFYPKLWHFSLFFLATKFWDKAREEEEEENSLL
jgi:hypothetical protein